jgi:hypothetical protein
MCRFHSKNHILKDSVLEVAILPYRANYQQGQPIYCSQKVQISVGFSPHNMHWKSKKIKIDNTYSTSAANFMTLLALHTISLGPQLVIGGYIRVDFLGRCQARGMRILCK